MEIGGGSNRRRFSSYERLALIGLAVLAVASPLYIDRKPASELEDEEESISFAILLTLLLFLLILAVALSACLDKSFTRFDRHWIHRVGGSSGEPAAGSILDKYVKRKRLDPLEVYVPPIILTQLQIKDLEKTLESAEPQFASCRSLLRAGPAASLRVNIRAVAQYASDSGNGKTAFNDVDQCLSALEELDSLLLHASRNEPDATVKSMKAKINASINALDSLLQTVPPDVLSKGKVIADSYRSMEDEDTASLGPELKQLEEIL